MKIQFQKRKLFWWLAGLAITLPTAFFGTLLLVLYFKQDAIVQHQLEAINKKYQGKVTIEDTHLAPFEDFPLISIKIDEVHVYETKAPEATAILNVADIFVRFNFWDIVTGSYDIQSLLIEEGFFHFVLHEDGSNNLENALLTSSEESSDDPMDIHLQEITLRNLDIHKLNESNQLIVETFVYQADGGFKSEGSLIHVHVDSKFELNVIDHGDTTFVKHKHFDIHTDLEYDSASGILAFEPSRIQMEHGDFELEGSLDTQKDNYVDIKVKGTKPNFDMLIAFAPEDLIPVLERYKNEGKIYFNALLEGPTAQGQLPFIDVQFGASEAFLENTSERKRIDDMGFQGHFTNGKERNLRTMEFSLINMAAKMENGNFLGSVEVVNFEEPEVDMELDADFNLEFLASFFNLSEIQDVSGRVALSMRFHDIIDLDHPEKALNDLNQAYFSELKITDFSLASTELPAQLERLNAHLIMNGKEAKLDQFDLKFGESDLSITGFLTDLPAIVHHTYDPVVAHLEIKSKRLDLAEITGYSKEDSTGIDEQIEDLRVSFSFNSSARAFTESKYLPHGEFFVESLHAQLKHYPHELHDFHVDVMIDERDLSIKDFTGYIDDSDFHFNGWVHDYGFWMQDVLNGDVDLDVTLKSDLLRLEDLFSYQGENYVPEDYRHEELEQLAVHINSSMHFRDSHLHSIDLELDKLEAKMHVHPLKFEEFNGRIHYEDDHLVVERFHGKMGQTRFDVDMNYYLGDDPTVRKRDNHLGLHASYIDFDQLFDFKLPGAEPDTQVAIFGTTMDVPKHADAFNIYELPFTDMTFDVEVGHFIYHRIDLQDIQAKMRTTENHYLYIDTLHMNAAGGKVDMSGYFNGSDPEHIYLKPNLNLTNVELDRVLFKFENFGQDVIVSDNLHGRISAHVTGKIRIYPDLVPDLDQSEVHADIEVLEGRLENYEYMLMLSDYMGDKDLTSIQFDTLKNHMDVTNGVLTIPNMTIESTLGHYELSGTQDMNYNMEYYIRVPWTVIKEGARYKMFGSKKTESGETGDDEIVKVDPKKKVKYLNLRIAGNMEDYKISLAKEK
ncbi:hypothetical protein KFE98_04925 [bacterium SCSIO 12741]|nr:hypothetical protein KFE98_04925 [bacterium SCSIO 12741]